MILKALGPQQYYDSDDEYTSDGVPLLKNAPPYIDQGYGHGHGHGLNNEAWVRVSDKVMPLLSVLDVWSHGMAGETMLLSMSVSVLRVCLLEMNYLLK
ncbi:unnamed protein product [Lupinus luteus]|uniref:Uncharacterized protein n=1 Tax=Lupinus luteus TaxID=3873 RepID=A0AAV1W456_LUPLU